jgi:hypothetical protein
VGVAQRSRYFAADLSASGLYVQSFDNEQALLSQVERDLSQYYDYAASRQNLHRSHEYDEQKRRLDAAYSHLTFSQAVNAHGIEYAIEICATIALLLVGIWKRLRISTRI